MKYTWKVDNKQKWFATESPKDHTVTINKKKNKQSGKGELIDTLAHERNHILHPKKSEKAIQALTKATKLTPKQKHKLYSKI